MGKVESEAVKEKGVLDQVIELLKGMDTKPDEYRPPQKGKMPPIHDRILREIKNRLEAAFRPKFGAYGIDYIKREDRDREYGRIELAVEVDRWRGAIGSWRKLLDIRADNRLWVFVPDQDKIADFEWSLNKLKDLVESRGEGKAPSGRFVAVMKRPTKFKVVEVVKIKRGRAG